jgi:hypothetical protein
MTTSFNVISNAPFTNPTIRRMRDLETPCIVSVTDSSLNIVYKENKYKYNDLSLLGYDTMSIREVTEVSEKVTAFIIRLYTTQSFFFLENFQTPN